MSNVREEVNAEVNPEYTGEDKVPLPTASEATDMNPVEIRALAFAVYANTTSTESVAMALRGIATLEEIERWHIIEEWDKRVNEIANRVQEPLQMIAKGWLFSRFMKMNTAVDTFVDKLPSSENGADADCYARGIERLHNAQMVMLDRPTEITRSESEDRSPRDKLRGYSLEQLTGAMDTLNRAAENRAMSEDD